MTKFVISNKTYIDDAVEEFRKKLEKILIDQNPINEDRDKYMYANVSIIVEIIDD